jgi:DNA-binding response OmpR family regulator
MMPQKSGYEICREIRKQDQRTPIILLTAKGRNRQGGGAGTRCRRLRPQTLRPSRAARPHRRGAARAAGPAKAAGANPDRFTLGSATIDRKAYRLERDGTSFDLTPRELKLLETFAACPGEVLSRNNLLNAAWGVDYFGTTRTLDQHIAQLRKKLEADPSAPRIILTVHGVGYKLAR